MNISVLFFAKEEKPKSTPPNSAGEKTKRATEWGEIHKTSNKNMHVGVQGGGFIYKLNPGCEFSREMYNF